MRQLMSRERIEEALKATRKEFEEIKATEKPVALPSTAGPKQRRMFVASLHLREESYLRHKHSVCMNLLVRLANLKMGLKIVTAESSLMIEELTPVIHLLAFEIGNVATESAFGLDEICAALAQVALIRRRD